MTSKEIAVVTKLRALLDEKVHVHSIMVFGSRARGNAGENSDLDVLVVTEEAETYDLLMTVYGCGFEAGLESGIVINTVVFSRDDWENGPERNSLLAETIKREGILV
jgi:predicted nucleotidyltransferase